MALKTFICEHCRKEFQDKDCRNRRFCSQKCTGSLRKPKMVSLVCEHCGKTFIRRYHKTRTPRFCSYECSAHGRPPRPKNPKPVVCIVCGTVKLDRPGATRKFCSYKCKSEWQRQSLVGENNPYWKGGHPDYYGPNWRPQRRKARQRDNYKCQHCGISEKRLGKQLDVHHIKPFRTFNGDYKQANQLTNLISLCNTCHTLAENNRIPIQPTLI